ncbi:hypothetical protein [Arcticibacterium luteifluviistationis]|uniref:Peptidase S74 domain-containing protein n=1 Tax=Arcticibacterium luteifluviistationis TaxID=1784714 RepID=A0A2Z4G9J9_9BACT|nr:hypothetical protein [Arcticibacterium luteifluviistationis]AWV97909.1 hypothetical protein DJ013_06900 [Arcticibacterium luteifluviistationis]
MNLKLQKGVVLTVLLAGLMLANKQVKAQNSGGVGIGTTLPDNSAILDLSSKNKGLLLPRMSLKERAAIVEPAKGLIVYQTNFMSGLYVYDGKNWSNINQSEARLTAEDTSIWSTFGNAGLSADDNFIGTTDDTPLVFKVNNYKSGLIDPERGNLFLGYRSGQNSAAYNSVVLGSLAMQKANTSGNNIALGFQSMFNNESGGHNIGIGTGSLVSNIAGNNNVAIGSLSGYKATGSSNVFLGFQSGYSEQGSNKLVVSNDANRTPLIYGDFLQGKIGFNTQELTSTVNINSNEANSSGLRFLKLNSQSPAANSTGKVLTVNANGEVVLTSDMVGEAAPTLWNINGDILENSNEGLVNIKNNLNVAGSLYSNKLSIGSGGLTLPFENQSNKILGLDNAGNVVTVDMPTVSSGGSSGSSDHWYVDGAGDLISTIGNSNRVHMFGMSLGWGGIKFKELNATYENPFPSNGLALSLDEFGNMILTKNSDGGTGASSGSGDSKWSQSGNIIFTPQDNKVAIGSGLQTLPDGYLLYVKKGILAERVRVAVATSSKWADYVFKDDYNLMPLHEVEKFIIENEHLPNVPSADEVADAGIDMAEMAAKQMEKIEELTLYLIDANKRIEKLEKKIATLE